MSKYLVGNTLDLSLLGDEPEKETVLSEESLNQSVVNSQEDETGKIARFLEITNELEKAEKYSGLNKWFKAGTDTSIDKLPKHKAFFKATKDFIEVYFSAANRIGKCLANSELIPTPQGYKRMGDLVEGDMVFGSNGKPTEVLGVYPQGKREIYNVTFRDGSVVRCDLEHLWTVKNNKRGRDAPYITLTLKEMIERKSATWTTPPRPVMDFTEKDLPLDPYLLGLLIGDGGLSTGVVLISSIDDEIVNYCREIAPEFNTELKHRGACTYQFVSYDNRHGRSINLLKNLIIGLGVDCTSHFKRIPEEYFFGSEDQRYELLRGLMDTDGHIGSENKVPVFYSVHKELCEDVQRLCNSLGITCTVRRKNGTYNGEKHVSWLTSLFVGDYKNPFKMKRKADLFCPRDGSRSGPTIVSIEPDCEEDATCIKVSAEDSLFLTETGIPTHNTVSAAFAFTSWATGIYPDWWEGRRYRGPVKLYAAGTTNKTTRDVIQRELLGDIGAWGTGMIPKDMIVGTSSKSGVPNAVDVIQVRNVSGEISTITLLAYEQGRTAFEGFLADAFWMDEMPPEDVYSEAYMRTATTKGVMMVTATPLDGMTPLVFKFYSESTFIPEDIELPSVIQIAREDKEREDDEKRRKGEKVSNVIRDSKAVILAGWDDAPWLDEETKIRLLAMRPPHLRQASSTGIPGTSGGSIYPIPLDDILIDDFVIPKHYKFINGLDVGWSTTACIFGAMDPDTETVYIYGEYFRGQAEPPIHAQAIKTKSIWPECPVAIDPASKGRGQADGKQLLKLYRDHGLRVNVADNAVESGIYNVWEGLSTGKLKIFKSCKQLQREYVTYHRDEKGRIVKDNDHGLDGLRYLYSTIHLARQQPIRNNIGTPKGVSGIKYF